MKQGGGGRSRLMWGMIYVLSFVAIFAVSAILKMTADPFRGAYRVDWDDSMGTVVSDLSYGEGEANRFDLYLPANDGRESYGLIVYLHAGGFTDGDKRDDEQMLKWLCAKEYVAAGINYTLRTGDNDASVYSQSVEIREAMPFVVAEAERRGYRLDRMAVSGGSAGGTLALLYAYRDADSAPVPVKMVFEMVGPASFHHEDWKCYGLDQSPDAAANLFSVMSGNAITPQMIASGSYADAVRNISADMWVDADSVPALLAYGRHDRICPYESALRLVDALEANDVPCDFIEFPHSGHGLQNDDRLYVRYMDLLDEYLNTYMGAA